MAGSAIFTTEPSINAMLDPRIVAASVSRLRFCETTTRDGGVAPMTPASHGGRMKPTIWASRKHAYEAVIVRADACIGNKQAVNFEPV
jgi:hypothetical protein